MKKAINLTILLFTVLLIFSGCSGKSTLKNENKGEINETISKLSETIDLDNEDITSSAEKINSPILVNSSDKSIDFDKEFFENNRKKILDKIKDNSIVILFSNFSSEYEKYSPNKNLYYLTGLSEDNTILLMSKIKGKTNITLYVKENNPQMAKWVGESLSKDEVKNVSGVEDIKYINTVDLDIRNLTSKVENIYLDLGPIDINDIKARKNINTELSRAQSLGIDLKEKYKDKKIYSNFNEISNLRSVKKSYEINKIKKAIDITNEGIKLMLKNSKNDIFEYQLESYFDFMVSSLGSKKLAFLSIIASGENGVVLHYSDNNSKLKKDDLVLVDVGATYDNYASDISRTFPVNGKFNERQKEIYNIVLKANKETIKMVKPGTNLRDLNDLAKNILAKECKKIGLIKNENEIQNYYFHAVSHSLGLDVHDPGIDLRPLEPGMVITIEPGLYIEEEGIGIRIEDDILVTEDGYINLSENIIKSIEDIENFMSK